MTRLYRRTVADHMAGTLAQHDGTCPRCDLPFTRLVSQVVRRKGVWVHTACVSGADQ